MYVQRSSEPRTQKKDLKVHTFFVGSFCVYKKSCIFAVLNLNLYSIMARYATEDRRRVDFRMRSKDVQFLDAMAQNSTYNNTRTAALEEVLGLVRYLSRLDNLLDGECSITWEERNASISLAKIRRILEDGKAL